nr:MAG: hypothetical protein [Sanya steitz-like virus 2]
MLSTDITINPGTTGGANVNNVYNLIGWKTPNSTLRRVAGTAGVAPDELTVSHQETVRSGVTVNRHMIRIDKTYNDSLKGAQKVSAWVVVEVPMGVTAITSTEYNEVLGRVHAALALSGLKTALYNGES